MDQKAVVEIDRKVCADKTASNMPSRKFKLTSSIYCFYSIQFTACKDLNQCRTIKKADNSQGAFKAASIMLIYNDQDSNILFDLITTLKDKNNYAQIFSTQTLHIYLRCTKQTCRQLFTEGLAIFTNSTLYGQGGDPLELDTEDKKKLVEFFLMKMRELEDHRVVLPPRSLPSDPLYSANVSEMVERDLIRSTVAWPTPAPCVSSKETTSFQAPEVSEMRTTTPTSLSSSMFRWCSLLALLWMLFN